MKRIGHVEMLVPDRIVPVPMAVRLGTGYRRVVVVVVMRIVTMDMGMLGPLVEMPMAV